MKSPKYVLSKSILQKGLAGRQLSHQPQPAEVKSLFLFLAFSLPVM
jgi:hypothetical protein